MRCPSTVEPKDWFAIIPTAADEWRPAACRHHQDLPWGGVHINGQDSRPGPRETEAMRQVCENECPIRKMCAIHALNGNSGHGERGGFWAGEWLPWSDQDGRESRDMRALARRRLMGYLNPPEERGRR